MAQSAYFSIDDDKLEAITKLANLPADQVEDFVLDDWKEGQEHQDWLNTASVKEIADWVIDGLR